MTMIRESNSKDGKRKSNGQKHSPKQEKEWAKRLGGNTTAASGAKNIKGDVRVRNIMRLENKCTSKASFRITYEMCQKIEDAALPAGEIPTIEVEFLDEQGRIKYQVAVVPVYVLELLASGVLSNNVEQQR